MQCILRTILKLYFFPYAIIQILQQSSTSLKPKDKILFLQTLPANKYTCLKQVKRDAY
jgi:hypothetical protein